MPKEILPTKLEEISNKHNKILNILVEGKSQFYLLLPKSDELM